MSSPAGFGVRSLVWSYFRGPATEWELADQRLLDHVVPENRPRSYEMSEIIETLADTGFVTELRSGFGLNSATLFEVDDVIAPSGSRSARRRRSPADRPARE